MMCWEKAYTEAKFTLFQSIVQIRNVIQSNENTILVDRSAVINKNNETYVFIEKDGVAYKKNVVTGLDKGDKIEIKSGITASDNIIVKGQTYLSDNEQVIVTVSEEEE